MKTVKENISINPHNLKDKYFLEEPLELPETNTYFGSNSIVIGYLLLLAGGLGIILPNLFGVKSMVIVALLVVLVSLSWIVHAYKYKLSRKTEWIKPLILFTTGSLMLFYPLNSISVISLLLVIYLFFDAIASFIFAYISRATSASELMIFNGLISLGLLVLVFYSF